MKTVWLILSALTVINFASSSLAAGYYPTPEEQCTSVDFRNTFPLKMRNQHDVSWCFAHATSDYLQYTFQINEQISAADVAINYSQSNLDKLMHFFQSMGGKEGRELPAQTGFQKVAVKKILPQGYCPESALPSDEWNRVDVTTGTQTKTEIKMAILETFDIQQDIKSGDIANPSQLSNYYTFKNIDRDQFYSILKNSKSSKLMENIRVAACKNDRRPFGQKISLDYKFRGKNIFNSINASFNAGMPVTIDFFDDIFRHYDKPKIDINNLHTVLVYGRKFNQETQQCQYMIKDSYGEQCFRYDPKIECEKGYVWLPENKLFHTLASRLILHK